MDRISYKNTTNSDVAVYCDGFRVGTITNETRRGQKFFWYVPYGKSRYSEFRGAEYSTLREVKQSLESITQLDDNV